MKDSPMDLDPSEGPKHRALLTLLKLPTDRMRQVSSAVRKRFHDNFIAVVGLAINPPLIPLSV